MDDPRLPLEHPANAALLAYFRSLERTARDVAEHPGYESCDPAEVPLEDVWLGAHPDVLTQMRGPVAAKLPEPCHWVVLGIPVLAHPHTGVIFAWAGGMDYALRLPRDELSAALRAGARQVYHARANQWTGTPAWTLDLRDIGPDWCFGHYRAEEAEWCLSAFHAAATGWHSPA